MNAAACCDVGHVSHHDGRGHWECDIHRPPEVQAVWVEVDVLRGRRVILHDALVLRPEEVFDPAHLAPVGRAAIERDADVLPAAAVLATGDDLQLCSGWPHENEAAGQTVARVAAQSAVADTACFQLFGHVSPHCSLQGILIERGSSGRPAVVILTDMPHSHSIM